MLRDSDNPYQRSGSWIPYQLCLSIITLIGNRDIGKDLRMNQIRTDNQNLPWNSKEKNKII